ncbi:hypothetical protein QTJ16_003383 [Diplocarpon rosae]|uniref:ATP-dependent RNA helicase n=1 Tax=Diplocarpon rosae TaxID=946125 RepID=A0AAD9T1J8_9HELO|nr:hypothetical protein QTJ16_003383 [Diplocarpon rosae]
MDILKLLSRSTKPSSKAGPRREISANLPSAGTTANPQLYQDTSLDSRGKKRKRAERVEEKTSNEPNEDENLDFFAPKSAAPKPKKTASVDNATRAPKLLDEEECRQILKSHRLKLTLLPSGKAPEKKTTTLAKAKVCKRTTAKDEYRRLYPQPLLAFGDLRSTYGISGRMAENLAQQGYNIPTEVQMASLPLLLRPGAALGESVNGEGGVDLLAVAPTGSGKTLAFLIPVVDNIVQRRRKREDKGVHSLEALVIAPTKELAAQIVNEAKKLSMGTGVKVVGMKKGMRIIEDGANPNDESSNEEDDDQEESSSYQPIAKTDILITTPGLLSSALTASSGSHARLPTVQTLILDEADVLLDPLFREQTLSIWKACTHPSLRVTLWSATMGSNIEALASSTVTSRRTLLSLPAAPIIRLVVGLKDSAIPNITHRLIYAATEPGKLLALRQLLHPTAGSDSNSFSLRPPFLIFTQTIPRAVALHSELLYDIPSEAGGSSRLAVLHSDLSDSARAAVMTRFRAGDIWILITTDILSRGVDFRGVNGVVNYDVPNCGAAYIHRVGRTGRGGRDGGVAVTFYTKEDVPYVKNVANIIAASEKQAGKQGSEAGMQKWLLDVLPTPTKEEKRRLRVHGVEARRTGLGAKVKEGAERGTGGKGKGTKGTRMQISTKSGYERQLENRKRGAIAGSQRRAKLDVEGESLHRPAGDDGEWAGIAE